MSRDIGTRVAVVQVAGRTPDEAAESLSACRALVAEAAAGRADVVVLPEGVYPAYVLGSAEAARSVLASGPDPVEAFSALAAERAVTLVAGLVVDSPAGLLNVAVTFAPDGAVLAQTAKRFLWHFDSGWFVAGRDSPVVDTAAGRMGALVCADARIPEIARTLCVRGAALVCQPTAWVTSTPRAPFNIQPEFLISARCIENGIAMACASKCGFEGDAVAYAGHSMIVGPDGRVLAEASADREEVVIGDVDLTGLPRPPAPRLAYADLAKAWDPQPPSAERVRVAAANCSGLRPLDRVDVFVSPDGVEVVGPVPRVAVVENVLAPEPARVAALNGAEVLAFVGDAPLAILRARAAENRCFVVAAGDPTVIVAPSGAVVADAPVAADRPFVCTTDCLLAESALKEMAPGTDVFAGRQPETYTDLVR